MNNKIVIIGGGVAAINAIKAIREIDSKAEINVFQNEKFYPYYRIRLTKSMFDNLEEDKILLQKKEWYELNYVDLHLDKEVVQIDTHKQEIILEDHSKFAYDKLLLANGSRNFILPIEGIDKENVYSIRKLNDIQNIKANVDNKKTILNIGGGIQGLETSWILHQHGKEVVIAEVQERLMPNQLDERASKILQNAIESVNIKMVLNTPIEKVIGEDKVKGVITKDGSTIECDMVIYSVGIRPNKEILKNTPVKTNIGVVVNERMQTTIENVYAAGDIAELNGRIGGLWSIAAEQGKIAGYNIAGKNDKYSGIIPVTTLNAFNLSLFSMGDINVSNCTQTLIEDSQDGKSYKRIFIRDNKIAGAIVIGDAKCSPILKTAIEKEIEFKNIDLTNISVNNFIIELKNIEI